LEVTVAVRITTHLAGRGTIALDRWREAEL
jgi:hypothetical protein